MLRSNRGAAYVMAVSTLLAGLILGQALLRLVGSGNAGEASRNGKDAALDMAEAGIAHAQMLLADRLTRLPYSCDVSLAYGSFHIDMVDDSTRMKKSVLVTSTGAYKDRQQRIRRCVVDDKGPLPYFWALASELPIVESDAVISAVRGGVRCNGAIALASPFNNVTTGLWSGNSVTGFGTLTPVYTFSRTIDFPQINIWYYQSVAGTSYPDDATFSGVLSVGSPTVIFVADNVQIRNLIYYGIITIVAGNDVKMEGTVVAGNSASKLAVVSPKKIEVSGNSSAVIYTKDVLQLKRSVTINGFAGCKELQLDAGPVTFDLDPGLTPAMMKQMRLPGTLPQTGAP